MLFSSKNNKKIFAPDMMPERRRGGKKESLFCLRKKSTQTETKRTFLKHHFTHTPQKNSNSVSIMNVFF
jgi:hypothetical protein